jgi:hypothetical protein
MVPEGYPVFFSGRANPSKNAPGIFFPENDRKPGSGTLINALDPGHLFAHNTIDQQPGVKNSEISWVDHGIHDHAGRLFVIECNVKQIYRHHTAP